MCKCINSRWHKKIYSVIHPDNIYAFFVSGSLCASLFERYMQYVPYSKQNSNDTPKTKNNRMTYNAR